MRSVPRHSLEMIFDPTLIGPQCGLQYGTFESILLAPQKQSDGAAQRYVLGNGQTVEYNTDGTFTIPETQTNLSLMAF